MGGFKRILAIAVVFGMTCVAWMVLGGVTSMRSSEQRGQLDGEVENLWGAPQTQLAPTVLFRWEVEREVKRTELTPQGSSQITETVIDKFDRPALLNSSTLDVGLRSDLRRKGLNWYSLYDVKFAGTYTYHHAESQSGFIDIAFPLPSTTGEYDSLTFKIDGQERARQLDTQNNRLLAVLAVHPGQDVKIEVGYGSRGQNAWSYTPTSGVGRLESFTLDMHTDFSEIDFPAGSMSPSSKTQRAGGWDLQWKFDSLVTGHTMGMVTPTRVQPGDLATELSFSAPISLFFFFLVIYVLATIRRIDIHPMNYFLIAGAFFAFHLLFAYSADHLPVEAAFGLASVVSVGLVVSYLRLVVSPAFASREAALAQVVYLIGFSLAHFWKGFTGLTVTLLAVITLFLLMQLTGRIRWSEVLSAAPGARPVEKEPLSV